MDDQEARQRRAPAEEDEQELEAFTATHQSLSNRVERFLTQAVILGLVALVLVQMLLVRPEVRRIVNLMEGADGIVLGQEAAWQESLRSQAAQDVGKNAAPQAVPASSVAKTYTITVVSMTRPSVPEAKLLVDGKVAGTFDKGGVTATVTPGQTIAVDATLVRADLKFRVVAAHRLASPKLGDEVTTRGDRKSLGVAKAEQ